MDIKSFRKLVLESPLKDQLSNIEITLHFDFLNYEIKLKGIQSIYKFVLDQVVGWNKIDKLPPYFIASKTHFESVKADIIRFTSYFNGNNQHYFNSEKDQIQNQLIKSKFNYRDFIFLYDSPETDFLISVYNKNTTFFNGALDYITQSETNHSNETGYFTGMLLAYEYRNQGNSEIVTRRNSEKLGLSQLKNKCNEYIVEAEQQLNGYITDAKENLTLHFESVDKLKDESNRIFKDWFNQENFDFEKFKDNSYEKIAELENLYRYKLKLEAPADYWKKRAKQLNSEGKSYLFWLIGVSLVACLLLFILLFSLGDGFFDTAFSDKMKGIKWSIILITIVSLLAFTIKILAKMTFSSFHLSRDAEEREQLTHFYLALKKDTEINEQERQLILQSLFSRADTGLLKDDSSPTMPTSIIEKFSNK